MWQLLPTLLPYLSHPPVSKGVSPPLSALGPWRVSLNLPDLILSEHLRSCSCSWRHCCWRLQVSSSIVYCCLRSMSWDSKVWQRSACSCHLLTWRVRSSLRLRLGERGSTRLTFFSNAPVPLGTCQFWLQDQHHELLPLWCTQPVLNVYMSRDYCLLLTNVIPNPFSRKSRLQSPLWHEPQHQSLIPWIMSTVHAPRNSHYTQSIHIKVTNRNKKGSPLKWKCTLFTPNWKQGWYV